MFQRTRGPVGFGFSWLKPPFDPPKEPEYRIKTLIECILCNDSVYYLKRLPCGHSMCESCIDKLIKCQRIECPFDTKGCTVKDGKAKNLPTKFAVSFACDDCSEDKHIDDMFFCKDCDANSCGTCSMKKHRSHAVNDWSEFEAVKDCLSFYKSFAGTNTESVCNKITDFCKQLENKLKKNYEFHLLAYNTISTVCQGFGLHSAIEPRTQPVKALEKKLKIISKLLQSRQDNVGLDVGRLVDVPKTNTLPKINIPEILRLVEQQVSGKVENREVSPQSASAVSVDEIEINFVKCLADLKEVTCICVVNVRTPSPLSNAANCSYSGEQICIVISTNAEIVVYDENFDEIHSEEFDEQARNRRIFTFPSNMVYHPVRQSVFVSRELDPKNSWGYVVEYNVPEIEQKESFDFPAIYPIRECKVCIRHEYMTSLDFPCVDSVVGSDFVNTVIDRGENDSPFLLGVLPNGELICAVFYRGTGSVWVRSINGRVREPWTKKWSIENGDDKSFDYLIANNDEKLGEIICISSQTRIYLFRLLQTKEKSHNFLLYSIVDCSNNGPYGPLCIWKKEICVYDYSKRQLLSVCNKRIVGALKFAGNCSPIIVCVSCCNDKIYLLNHSRWIHTSV